MPHNPSRYTLKALEESDQAAVDAYKARSVWGAWWKLGEDVRQRFFTDEQRRFIQRHGQRLDGLACLVEAPRSVAEQHFVRVCSGELAPTSNKERLWLLVQIVCRYEDASVRAARVSIAEHTANALEAEIHGLRIMARETDQLLAELVADYRLQHHGESPARGRISNCNVEHATLHFRRRDGSTPIRSYVADPAFRWNPLVLPGSTSAIAQWSSDSPS